MLMSNKVLNIIKTVPIYNNRHNILSFILYGRLKIHCDTQCIHFFLTIVTKKNNLHQQTSV